MKKILLFVLLLVVGISVNAQESPVTLEPQVNHLEGDKYELIIKATIDPDWCMYSQDLPEGGPYPTTISFAKNKNIQFLGKAKEASEHRKDVVDEIFDMKLTKYYDNVLFRQVVVIKNKNKVKKLAADVDFMSCSIETCMPPMQERVEFEFKK